MKNLLRLLSFPLLLALSIILFVIIFANTKINCFLLFLFFLIVFLSLFILFLILKKKQLAISSILISMVLFIFTFRLAYIENDYKFALENINSSTGAIGYVSEFPVRKNGKLDLNVKVIGVKNRDIKDFIFIKPFNIRVTLSDDIIINLHKGTAIIINQKVSLPREKVFDYQYRKNLYYNNIYGVVSLKQENLKISNLKLAPAYYNFFNKNIWKMRDKILLNLKTNLNKESYAFILSIFFGIKSEMDRTTYDDFSISGMLHLLAISGLHIGFIAGFFLSLFKTFLSKSISYIISLIILSLYMLLIIVSPSSERAYLMYFIQALFFIIGFTSSSLAVVSLSAIILLFINPFFVFNVGFQLSFLATVGIIMFSNDLDDLFFIVPINKPRKILSISMGTFLSLFVVQWILFQRAYLFSIFTSLIMIPLFEIIFIFLFFSIIVIGIFNLFIFAKIVDFIVFIYLKLVYYSALVLPISLPKIDPVFGYILIPISLILSYLAIFNIGKIKKLFFKK